jgi:hypothetical protein
LIDDAEAAKKSGNLDKIKKAIMEMAKVKEVKLENDSGLFGIGGDAKKAL